MNRAHSRPDGRACTHKYDCQKIKKEKVCSCGTKVCSNWK